MIIKVLGSGCSNCKKVVINVELALKELNLEASVEKVEAVSYTHLTLPTTPYV